MKKVRLTIAPDLELEVNDIEYENLAGQGLLVEDNNDEAKASKDKESK